jgi:hypothetical protein
VFGVSDLKFEKIRGDESGDEIRYGVSYMLWLPATAEAPLSEDLEELNRAVLEPEPLLPRGYPITDEITLIRHKGNWRISEINRLGS